MSAYGYKQTYSGQLANVRFTPNSGHSAALERVGRKKQTLDAGVLAALTNTSGRAYTSSPGTIRVGSLANSANQYSDVMDGWIDDARITIGVARWVASFTPPIIQVPIKGP